jgi:LysR family transcriptional regulator, low CO2-responsive transcriptional regulator
MKNATFRQLRVFNEVAKHMSFAKAAQSLHLSPPAITMQIKELEGHVGLPLFDRTGKKISLTTTGEYLLVYARKILATLKDAEDATARLQKLEIGTLTIGMVSTAKYFLPHMLAEFKREHPGIDVKLVVGNRQQLVNLLEGSEVDIAVMGRPPEKMATRAEPFAAHPHVFIAAPNHALLAQEMVSVMDILKEAFISREQGSGTRAALEKFLQRQTVELNIAMETDSNETIKQAVMAGMGISFLSLHTVGLELDHQLLKIIPVDGAPVVRKWNCVHTLSKMLSPAAEYWRMARHP